MVWTLLFALFFHIPYLNAQQLQAKLTGANDPSLATVKGFGNAVDIYGDTAVVGCDTCDVGTKSCGTVFVYTYTNGIWQADQLLAPSNLVDSIYFGRKVKINQDYILVSAPDIAQTSTTSRPGSAYLFERSWDNVWYEAVNFKLDFDSSNKDKGLPYGSSIALCNDYAFVGCEDCDVTVDNGFNFQLDTGLVDVYRRVNGKWQLFQRLRPALQQITGTTPRFGSDIDTDCDGTGTKRAVIGADTDRLDANIIGAGSALIYVLDDATGLWNFEQKIWYLGTQPNQANLFVNDYFGHAVAIDGDFVTVGAFADNQDANEGYIAQDVGSIYFWERDTTSGQWQLQRKESPKDIAVNYRLSRSGMAMYGKWCVVTCEQNDDLADNAGAVYVYERDPTSGIWGNASLLFNYDWIAGDFFGTSVSIYGKFIIAGADGGDEHSLGSGTAYIISNWNDTTNAIQSYTEASGINIIKTPGSSDAPTQTSVNPTTDPTKDPTQPPSLHPSNIPTMTSADPTNVPTVEPTYDPTNDPTSNPIKVTPQPTASPVDGVVSATDAPGNNNIESTESFGGVNSGSDGVSCIWLCFMMFVMMMQFVAM